MCNVCVLPQQIASLGTRGEPFFSWHMKLQGERAFECCIQTSSCAQLQNFKKKKKKLHLNTITRVPFLLTAAQKNRMALIVWKPAAICHIIMSAAALIRNPLGKVSEVASAIASSHTSVLLHIWNFICLLSQHRFLTLIVSSGREVLMCDGRKHEFLTHIHLTTDETGWLKRSGRLSDSKRSNHSQIQQNI